MKGQRKDGGKLLGSLLREYRVSMWRSIEVITVTSKYSKEGICQLVFGCLI
jgi:hypothetical protein